MAAMDCWLSSFIASMEVSIRLQTYEDNEGSVREKKFYRANQQIALSQGVNDSGLFELKFEDARYLPFEGTGAVSSWQLSIPDKANPNVLASLTDVIITLRYTALAGDASLQQAIENIVYNNDDSRANNNTA